MLGKVTKKKYFLEILAEKKDFNGLELRVNGKTVEEKDEIPKGSYQTIEVEPGADITIKKERWSSYALKKINESTSENKQKILIVVFDRESAIFAKTKKSGFEILFELQGDVQKKAYETKKEGKFFQEIISKIKERVDRNKITNVILASPAFWREDLMKLIKDDKLKKMTFSVNCSSVSENAIYEVLKSDAIKKIMDKERASSEIKLVEEVVKEISKSGMAAYGLEEVSTMVDNGNIRELLFTDKFFMKKQEEEKGKEIDNLIGDAEKKKAEVHIISSDHEGGQKLDGLGGIAALLRYKSYT